MLLSQTKTHDSIERPKTQQNIGFRKKYLKINCNGS